MNRRYAEGTVAARSSSCLLRLTVLGLGLLLVAGWTAYVVVIPALASLASAGLVAVASVLVYSAWVHVVLMAVYLASRWILLVPMGGWGNASDVVVLVEIGRWATEWWLNSF